MYMYDNKVQVPYKNITFVISQFHAKNRVIQEFNKDFAKALAWDVYLKGELPVLPHLYFPRFLGDDGKEREWGIQAGHCLMSFYSKAVVAVVDGYISNGMQKDIIFASSAGIVTETVEFSRDTALELVKRFLESRA